MLELLTLPKGYKIAHKTHLIVFTYGKYLLDKFLCIEKYKIIFNHLHLAFINLYSVANTPK